MKKNNCSECKKLHKQLKEQNERFARSLERISKMISFESYIARKALREEDITVEMMQDWERRMEKTIDG
jgi:hypothetical protein